nr:MAG TPA: hypothetical protein [Caudoviricetes sp.]
MKDPLPRVLPCPVYTYKYIYVSFPPSKRGELAMFHTALPTVPPQSGYFLPLWEFV